MILLLSSFLEFCKSLEPDSQSADPDSPILLTLCSFIYLLNVFKLPFTGKKSALLITPQPLCSDCITTWPSPSPQHHWPTTLSETHSSHKHNALYIFWGVMTYTINFHVWSSNDLNTPPDLVSISLDETKHQFFFNTLASNCGTAHSLVQLTQHLHFV